MNDARLGQSLVDAGFPRKFHHTADALIDPTLTELVDQCVEFAPSAEFTLERHGGGTWSASSMSGSMRCSGKSESAEDAAATLWLLLRSN
jgi:hypothetical protein